MIGAGGGLVRFTMELSPTPARKVTRSFSCSFSCWSSALPVSHSTYYASYFACLNMNHYCSVSLSYSLFSSLIFSVSVHYSDTLCYSHFPHKPVYILLTGSCSAGQRSFSCFAPQYHLLHINPFALFALLSSSMLYTAHCSSCTCPRLRLLLHSCIAPCSKPLHYVALLHCIAPTMSFAHCS